MKKLHFLFVFLFVFTLSSTAQSLETLWSTAPVFRVPESVLYNPNTYEVYVSNINGKSDVKDHNGFISKLDKDGEIIEREWVKKLDAPKGMALVGNILYVSDINRLVKINALTGTIIRKYKADSARFLNDVVADEKGVVYVSDSRLGAIFRLEHNKLKLWKKSSLLTGANGLAFENGKLMVGVRGYLLCIDPLMQSMNIVVENKGGIDGLIPLGKGKYLVSDWAGKIQIIEHGKSPVVLSNTSSQKINAADLGYITEGKIILIPTFNDQRVIAKKLTGE
jgi:outer membrane protein assembly factor BamB